MRKTTLSMAVIAALGSSVALAGQLPETWYGGMSVGMSTYEDMDLQAPLAAPESSDDDKAGGRIYGGYKLNDWFAVEGGYDYLNKMKAGIAATPGMNATIEVQGLDVTGKASYSVNDMIDLYGRAGAFFFQADADDLHLDPADGIAPTASVGAEFTVDNNWAARVEYQRVFQMDAMDDIGIQTDNGLFSVGVIYRYGQYKPEPVVVAPAPAPVPTMVKVHKEFNLSSDVLFGFDKSTLSAEGESALSDLVKQIKAETPTGGTADVVGHTDRIGSTEYNQKLSVSRAQTVANYMVTLGIPADKINVQGRGESESVTGDSCKKMGRAETIKCLAPDRRVVIKIDGVKEVEVTQ